MTIQRAFVPTDEQQAIAQAFEDVLKQFYPPESIAIDAGAGTGKSRTLVYLLEMLQESIKKSGKKAPSTLMLQFNKSIKQEMEEKLEKAGLKQLASVKTFNGLGFGAFIKNYGVKEADREVFIDTSKYKRIARFLIERNIPVEQRSKEEIKDAVDMLVRLFDFFRVNTTRHHKTNALSVFMGGNIYDEQTLAAHDPADIETVRQIANRYDLWIDRAEDEAVIYGLLPQMFRLGKLGFEDPVRAKQTFFEAHFADKLDGVKRWCDFTDQVYECVVNNWRVFGYSIVMVDEAQDTSPLDRALVDQHLWRKEGKRMGRVIMVGDPQQAIYKFRGADGDGFQNSMRFWYIKKAYPLSLSYRVPQVIAALASGHKPGYKAHTSNIEGEIATVNEDDLIKMAQDGDLCVSRVRAGMIPLRNKFLKAGKPARIMGSDISEIIVGLLQTISEMEGYTWRKTIEFINRYRDVKLEKMRERKKSEEDIERFNDNIQTVIDIVDALENVSTLDEAIERIQYDLNPENQPKGGIIIATGHVVKGMEFNHVFNITPTRFPMVRQDQPYEDYEQELNLKYVVETRTIQAYYLLDPQAPSYFSQQRDDDGDHDRKLMLEVKSDTGQTALIPIPNLRPLPLPAALPAPIPEPAVAATFTGADLPWCEWCGDKPAAPGDPCESCKQLGATAENHPSKLRELIAPPAITEPPAAPESKPVPELNWAQKLLAGEFVILDYETTSKAGEPVQIALIDHTGKVLLNTLVKPLTQKIDQYALAVHGITHEMVKDSPTFTTVYFSQLEQLLKNKIVVAYNAPFERKTTEFACKAYKLPVPEGIQWECTMQAYRSFNPASRWKLTDACEALGVKVDGEAHDALIDVQLTLGLIKAMAGVKEEVQPAPEPVEAEHVEADGTCPYMIENILGVPPGEDYLTWKKPAAPPPEIKPIEVIPFRASGNLKADLLRQREQATAATTRRIPPAAQTRLVEVFDRLEVDEIDQLIEVLRDLRASKVKA